jgi:predicted transcriptional regulator
MPIELNMSGIALTSEREILLLQKIEIAERQIANGEFLTEEEMDAEIESWGKTS